MAVSRRKITSRNANLLRRDRGYGEVVLYRKVPGRGRHYYDPKRPENPPVTEDYYLRVYKPSLSPQDRERINLASRKNVHTQRAQQNSLASTWMLRQAAEGHPVTTLNEAKKDAQFKQAYQQFRETTYEARYANALENTVAQRQAPVAAGSEYSELLVEMGRRTGLETFPVGESNLHVGAGQSYIDEVVKPYLEEGIDVLAQQQGATQQTTPVSSGASTAQAAADRAADRAAMLREKQAMRRGDYS